MIENAFRIGLVIAAVYLTAGGGVALLFFSRWIRSFDPLAWEGSRGFKVLVTPGIIALWPWVVLKVLSNRKSPSVEGAAQLRRRHHLAFIFIAIAGSLLFAAAIAWKAPGFGDLPTFEIPTP